MSAPSHYNARIDGEPGGTDFTKMSTEQLALIEHFVRRMKRDPQSVACYILNHTSHKEQAEALRVYSLT